MTGMRYATTQCSLGWVLLAAREDGVCAILLGDAPEELTKDLQKRFPRETPWEDGVGLRAWLAQVVEAIERPGTALTLPWAERGTRFQQRVWRELKAVPAGSTTSYRELAARVGNPKAVRAVARACAANPLAVAVPCHRVLRVDGELAGYRWGLDRKRALLEREALAWA
ncbi:methylated-DNA--[protein]-cysteine S-methyltransferase [uncultured Paludibaculum sp.]|uniref:methylated-DNA--[protein]-cysteine S-methyltransferase n=1 Tax=uncultured Paludibaculum sp. TaxID=1765020 RepID=UPI002AAC0BF0|nr:methylated-DNA--[protein]-cysteine S-methyltransferase [uncultured Paludibaculum sp.]